LKRTAVAFDMESWRTNTRQGQRIPDGSLVTLGFDGSRGSQDPKSVPDHTGLVATDVRTGHQVPIGHWDPAAYGGMIPRDLVDIAVDDAFSRFDVWRLYADPPGWDSEISAWRAKYGETRVIEWFTWRERQMGYACSNYATAIATGELTHAGDPDLTAHVGHAHKRMLNIRDDKGDRMWTIGKERDGGQLKIDLAVCGVISWEARMDAIAAGAGDDMSSAYAGLTAKQIAKRMRV